MSPILQQAPETLQIPNFPYDITFADCDPSPAMQALIERYLAKLARFQDRIIDAEVVVRIPHKHGQRRFFHIHVKIDVPGRQIVVAREPEVRPDHTSIAIAIHDAFDKVTRQLEDHVSLRRNRRAGRSDERRETGEAP